MYLKRGFNKAWEAIRKKNKLLVGLLVIQLIFVVLLTYVTMIYSVSIMNDLKDIIEPVEQANFDQEDMDQNQLMKQLLPVYKSYNSLKSNLLGFAGWLAALFVIFHGGLWVLSHKLLGSKGILKMWIKHFVASVFWLGLFILGTYLVFNTANMENLRANMFILGGIFLVFYFFLATSLAHINVKDWKRYLNRTLKSFKKGHYVLLVFAINLLVIAAGVFLIYLGRNRFFFGSMFMAIFFILLILTRLFWIACLHEKYNEKHKGGNS
jgi:hypothetical protein